MLVLCSLFTQCLCMILMYLAIGQHINGSNMLGYNPSLCFGNMAINAVFAYHLWLCPIIPKEFTIDFVNSYMGNEGFVNMYSTF